MTISTSMSVFMKRALLLCVACWLGLCMVVEDPSATETTASLTSTRSSTSSRSSSRSSFRIGVLKFDAFGRDDEVRDRFIMDVLSECEDMKIEPSFDSIEVFLLFKSMQGWRVGEAETSGIHRTSEAVQGEAAVILSHRINSCASRVSLNEVKEALFHVALAVWPRNTYVMKNLLYYYEWHGYNAAMHALYKDALLLTDDESLKLQYIFVAPPILHNVQQGEDIHIDMLRKAYNFILNGRTSNSNPDHEIRELQQNIEYIGLSTGIVMELYSLSLSKRYLPFFQRSVPLLEPASALATTESGWSRTTYRVGILSEHANNGAPDLCIADVFETMPLLCNESTILSDTQCINLELVFFDRERLNNHFAAVLRRRATEVVVLKESDLVVSAQSILEAKVDVLMYISLPTEKYTVFLSQFRLAKTQIVFGTGHPMTSGSANIDYNIFSNLFVHDTTVLTRRTEASRLLATPDSTALSSSYQHHHHSLGLQCARAAFLSTDYEEFSTRFPVCSNVGSAGNTIYTEQTILMDSLGYFLPDLSLHYNDYPEYRHQRFLPTTESVDPLSCVEVDVMLQSWGLVNISTKYYNIPCVSSVREGANNDLKKRLYMCIQLNRKMHPLFDRVLKGILQADPLAVIAVSHKAEILVDRWMTSIGFQDLDSLYQRFVFVPKLHHPDYLKFLSFNAVLLNTFPFGAGITTSEALAMCVPVLVLPDLVSTAQLALAQIRMLGRGDISTQSDEESLLEGILTAHSIEDYVFHATHIAGLMDIASSADISYYSGNQTYSNETEYIFYSKLLSLSGPDVSGNMHQGLRRHICSKKANLFSTQVLESVATEWRALLQRLVSS